VNRGASAGVCLKGTILGREVGVGKCAIGYQLSAFSFLTTYDSRLTTHDSRLTDLPTHRLTDSGLTRCATIST
jgi:hypothetical protein